MSQDPHWAFRAAGPLCQHAPEAPGIPIASDASDQKFLADPIQVLHPADWSLLHRSKE